MPRLQAIAASIRKRFYDNFAARTNTTGSLGTATDGSTWNAVNGTIQVTSGAAVATSTPSSGGAGNTYPMATVTLPTSDNVIKIAGANDGSAAAIWVQSGTDWWMVDVEADQTITANYAYQWTTYYAPQYSAYTVSTPGATTSAQYNVTYGFVSTGSSTRWTSTSSGTRRSYASTTTPASYGYSVYSTGAPVYTTTQAPSSYAQYSYSINYGADVSSTFLSGYTTVKNEYLKIRHSVSNVVSVITSQLISTSQSIASFLVSIAGNVITARAYSDTNFVTQIGSDLVYTATGATVTTQYGISLAPSTNYQSTTIGTSVDITRA